MSSQRSHDEIRGSLGAYAVAAVDDVERRAIERHLEGCAECRAEVALHIETLAGITDDEAPPPPQLWERIERGLGSDALAPRVAPPVAPPVAWGATGRRRLVGVLAAALAAVVALLGWRVVDLDRRLDRMSGGVRAAAAGALADPEARRVVLRSADSALAVDAVILPDGQGYLLQGNLGDLSPAETYQLWAFVNEEPISVGVLGPAPGVRAFAISPQTTTLAITAETAGGVPSPQHAPLVTADLAIA